MSYVTNKRDDKPSNIRGAGVDVGKRAVHVALATIAKINLNNAVTGRFHADGFEHGQGR